MSIGEDFDPPVNPEYPPGNLIVPGMIWKQSGSNPAQYGVPKYFLPVSPVIAPVTVINNGYFPGRIQTFRGLIANDGAVNTWAASDGAFSWMVYDSGQPGATMTLIKTLPDNLVTGGDSFSGAILDKNRALFVVNQYGSPSTQFLLSEAAVQPTDITFMWEGSSRETDLCLAPNLKNDQQQRLWITTGDRIFLEKRVGGTGENRWHQPPSMADGAICLNARGEAITRRAPYATPPAPPKIWRNGKYTDLDEEASKPETVTITEAIDLASNGIILAQADDDGVTKTGLLMPCEIVSRDKFFAGSFTIPEGWNSLEMEFVGPDEENLGKYGNLLGGGSTKIYDKVEDILADPDYAAGGQAATQKVWFIKDSFDSRKISYYTCFNSTGDVSIRFYQNGGAQAVGEITHTLTAAQDFAAVIDYVDEWVKGTSFYFSGPVQPPLLLMASPQTAMGNEGIDNLTRAALIPFFNVITQVEGLASVAFGLFDGVKNGIEDDWAFLQLIGQAGVAAGDWAHQQAAAELQKWKDQPLKRAAELKQLADRLCQDWVFKPMEELRADLSTWEGFKKRSWQTWSRIKGTADTAWTLTKSAWEGVVNGLTGWADDFCDRMMSGVEKAHWQAAPWATYHLLAEINTTNRQMCYTFGYTFGYICEQVAVGALSAGTVKIAQVATKGGVSLADNLAKRTAANVAARANMLKRLLAETTKLPDDLVRAYQRGFSLASTGPTGEAMDQCVMHMMQQTADAGKFVWREYVENIVGKTNIRQFVKQGSAGIIERRMSQLMHIMGDEFSPQIARNFLKVADEVILVPTTGGNVDEFFEAFFRSFDGNPGLMVNADIGATFSKSSLTAEGKATLKKFLSDPNAGKLWDIVVPAIVNNEPAIPHNYWIRGLLGELAIYKRMYKNSGYTHFPTAQAFDLKSVAEYVQIKTLKNPDGAYNAMKNAVDALADLPNPPNGLKLHILKKPGSTSAQLQTSLDQYILNHPSGKHIDLVIQEFELIP
jgi:hypothetical protein